MVEGPWEWVRSGKGAIAPVLLSFSKLCFHIITENMLENNSSQRDKKVKI